MSRFADGHGHSEEVDAKIRALGDRVRASGDRRAAGPLTVRWVRPSRPRAVPEDTTCP